MFMVRQLELSDAEFERDLATVEQDRAPWPNWSSGQRRSDAYASPAQSPAYL